MAIELSPPLFLSFGFPLLYCALLLLKRQILCCLGRIEAHKTGKAIIDGGTGFASGVGAAHRFLAEAGRCDIGGSRSSRDRW